MSTAPKPNPTPPARADDQSVLAGGVVDRRTILRGALRAAAGAGVALGVPTVLAGCGQYLVAPRVRPTLLITLVLDPYIEFPGIETLIAGRAKSLGLAVVLNRWPLEGPNEASEGGVTEGSELQQSMGVNAGPIDDATAKYPPIYSGFVVQTPQPATLGPIAQDAVGSGAKVVSFLTPFEHQTAQITVDSGQLGTLLATHAASWARENRYDDATVVFAQPEFNTSSFFATASTLPAEERAIRAALARLNPNLTLTFVQGFTGVARALRSDRSVRIVLCAIDSDAVAVAQMQRGRDSTDRGEAAFYIGALGAPTASPAALTELRRDRDLRAIAAVRPRDVAHALVDLPAALIKKKKPHDIVVPPQLLTPRSPALSAYEADYHHPDPYPQSDPDQGDTVYLNSSVGPLGIVVAGRYVPAGSQ
jgi:ABC-type sugar transport system substrate-binding protein